MVLSYQHHIYPTAHYRRFPYSLLETVRLLQPLPTNLRVVTQLQTLQLLLFHDTAARNICARNLQLLQLIVVSQEAVQALI